MPMTDLDTVVSSLLPGAVLFCLVGKENDPGS